VISIDSYHYYGTSESYFVDVFSKLTKPGGQLGIVVPGLSREFEKGYPETLKELWFPELYTFHSNKWWRNLWEKTGLCDIIACYDIEDTRGIWQLWADWSVENMVKEFGGSEEEAVCDMKLLDADTDNDLAMVAMAARKHM